MRMMLVFLLTSFSFVGFSSEVEDVRDQLLKSLGPCSLHPAENPTNLGKSFKVKEIAYECPHKVAISFSEIQEGGKLVRSDVAVYGTPQSFSTGMVDSIIKKALDRWGCALLRSGLKSKRNSRDLFNCSPFDITRDVFQNENGIDGFMLRREGKRHRKSE